MTTKHNDERMARMEEKTSNIESKLDQHMSDSKAFHTQMLAKFDSLDERYPTRREVKAVYFLFGIAISIIGTVVALIKL